MRSGLGNLVMGAVGMILVGAFLIGLAVSIGSIPFGVIVGGVLVLAAYVYFEEGIQPILRSSDADRSGTGG
jgi:hypothetical protein